MPSILFFLAYVVILCVGVASVKLREARHAARLRDFHVRRLEADNRRRAEADARRERGE